MRSETVASLSERRWTIRRRFTSDNALWTRRSVRSSSGGSTTDARVDRKWAGEGAKRRDLRVGVGRGGARRIKRGLYQYALMADPCQGLFGCAGAARTLGRWPAG